MITAANCAPARRVPDVWAPLRAAAVILSLMVAPIIDASAQATDTLRLKPINRDAMRAVMESLKDGDLNRARMRARNSRDGALIDLVTWTTLNDRKQKPSFGVLRRFIAEHDDWPGQGSLLLRAEQALPGNLSAAAIVRWFTAHPPVSGHGLVVQLTAMKERGDIEGIRDILRDRWTSIPTTPAIERRFVERFGRYISVNLDKQRLDRLLLERRSVEARRVAKRLGEPHQRLANARIVLADNSSGADDAIKAIPVELSGDPGLALQRATWRRNRDRPAAAAELLMEPMGEVNRPDLWWRERRLIARALFYDDDIITAYEVIRAGAGHQPGGTDWALAEFFAGWLALVHLNEPTDALKHFQRLFDYATTPVTKARGAYWLGRAYAAAGAEDRDSNAWFQTAAAFPWVYYGQRAADRLGQELELPGPPPLSAGAARRYSRRTAVRLVEGLTAIGEQRLATRFISALIATADSPIALHATAALANSVKRPDMVVLAAREASREGYALIPAGHPRLQHPPRLATDPLSLAIIRQESQFKPTARSTAGAVGLMQLMPATAKYTAGKLGIPYDRALLGRDVEYNVTLGTAVIDQAMDRYDSRLPLVAAAYNAGGTRVSRWLKKYGDPGTDADAMDDFVEAIPFPETRNYVHRVLENERIYRALLNRVDGQQARR